MNPKTKFVFSCSEKLVILRNLKYLIFIYEALISLTQGYCSGKRSKNQKQQPNNLRSDLHNRYLKWNSLHELSTRLAARSISTVKWFLPLKLLAVIVCSILIISSLAL